MFGIPDLNGSCGDPTAAAVNKAYEGGRRLAANDQLLQMYKHCGPAVEVVPPPTDESPLPGHQLAGVETSSSLPAANDSHTGAGEGGTAATVAGLGEHFPVTNEAGGRSNVPGDAPAAPGGCLSAEQGQLQASLALNSSPTAAIMRSEDGTGSAAAPLAYNSGPAASGSSIDACTGAAASTTTSATVTAAAATTTTGSKKKKRKRRRYGAAAAAGEGGDSSSVQDAACANNGDNDHRVADGATMIAGGGGGVAKVGAGAAATTHPATAAHIAAMVAATPGVSPSAIAAAAAAAAAALAGFSGSPSCADTPATAAAAAKEGGSSASRAKKAKRSRGSASRRMGEAGEGGTLDSEVAMMPAAGVAAGANRNFYPEDVSAGTSCSFESVGGMTNLKLELRRSVVRPFKNRILYTAAGVAPPTGVLLHGPPGCGKTMLARAVAAEVQKSAAAAVFCVHAGELIGGTAGESEATVRRLFECLRSWAPSLLLLEDVEGIGGRRESSARESEKRLVTQLCACLDDIHKDASGGKALVMVVATTSRPDGLDSRLRSSNRFTFEVNVAPPDPSDRSAILRVVCAKMSLAPDVDFESLGRQTMGFVGGDLRTLASAAGMLRVEAAFETKEREQQVKQEDVGGDMEVRQGPAADADKYEFTPEELSDVSVRQQDFLAALPSIQPTLLREGFETVPAECWDDVGGLESIRTELEERVVLPLRHPGAYKLLGLDSPSGILLHGPPGCGKTLLAKALAHHSDAAFISVKGPQLFSKFVGESESQVREVFARARRAAPCIIFFDEIDALCSARGSDSGAGAADRVVAAMLTELDGVGRRGAVFVVAATNRPDLVDPALKRPGRLDRFVRFVRPFTSHHITYMHTPSAVGRSCHAEAVTLND
eukprot:GHVU01039791.1.p1 GENE.GHVU01039791.1~~GHVU01039791.1.p1  ORF type:complete len:886 (+),score=158.30 GHVU01039791.1:485-3142(+)